MGNQICGVQEDEINKPDRPIASGATSLKAARIRWAVLTVLYFSYGCYLGVGIWSAMWIAISFAHNFLSFGDFGPTKDMCIGLGCVAQLTAAWLIGGAPYEVGWNWIKIIALYTLFPIPLQDLRDVPGDLAVGRRTTPILMGDMPCTFTLFRFPYSFTNLKRPHLHLSRSLHLPIPPHQIPHPGPSSRLVHRGPLHGTGHFGPYCHFPTFRVPRRQERSLLVSTLHCDLPIPALVGMHHASVTSDRPCLSRGDSSLSI